MSKKYDKARSAIDLTVRKIVENSNQDPKEVRRRIIGEQHKFDRGEMDNKRKQKQ